MENFLKILFDFFLNSGKENVRFPDSPDFDNFPVFCALRAIKANFDFKVEPELVFDPLVILGRVRQKVVP